MAKVAVIIPTHNRSTYLRNALRSVLAQTFNDFEIVVVDDASSDDTEGVVREFEGKPIKYIRHEHAKGGSGARNTGITNSQSEYIAFLDDDDEWLPDKLALQVALLDHGSPQVGLIYTGCETIDRATKKILGIRKPTYRGNLSGAMLNSNCIGSTSSTLLRRDCFYQVGLFDEGLPSFQDYDLWIRVAAKYEVDYVPQPLLKYYTHGEKIWTNPESISNGITLLLDKYQTDTSSLRKYLSVYMIGVGEMYCREGNFRKGRVAYLRAIKLYPYAAKYYLHLTLSMLGKDHWRKVKSFKQKYFVV